MSKIQASLPWLLQETQIRRDAKTLQYGNQVAWVEAERSLAEEQQELGVLACQSARKGPSIGVQKGPLCRC